MAVFAGLKNCSTTDTDFRAGISPTFTLGPKRRRGACCRTGGVLQGNATGQIVHHQPDVGQRVVSPVGDPQRLHELSGHAIVPEAPAGNGHLGGGVRLAGGDRFQQESYQVLIGGRSRAAAPPARRSLWRLWAGPPPSRSDSSESRNFHPDWESHATSGFHSLPGLAHGPGGQSRRCSPGRRWFAPPVRRDYPPAPPPRSAIDGYRRSGCCSKCRRQECWLEGRASSDSAGRAADPAPRVLPQRGRAIQTSHAGKGPWLAAESGKRPAARPPDTPPAATRQRPTPSPVRPGRTRRRCCCCTGDT